MTNRAEQKGPEDVTVSIPADPMPSTFWMTAQEAEDEIKRREAIAERITNH